MENMMNEQQPTGPASNEQLRQLWQLLLDRFLADMSDPEFRPNASYLDIMRAFLKDNGMLIDGATLLDARQSLAALKGLSLPFND